MALLIECVIGCALFALVVYLGSSDPIADVHNYPPAIIQRCLDLGLITEKQQYRSKATLLKKLGGAILFLAAFVLLAIKVNHCTGFMDSFIVAFVIWNAINWWDAIVIDCIWFCHDKRFIIPGTEDMVDAYHDYMFHIVGSLKGTAYGAVIAAIVGLIVKLVK